MQIQILLPDQRPKAADRRGKEDKDRQHRHRYGAGRSVFDHGHAETDPSCCRAECGSKRRKRAENIRENGEITKDLAEPPVVLFHLPAGVDDGRRDHERIRDVQNNTCHSSLPVGVCRDAVQIGVFRLPDLRDQKKQGNCHERHADDQEEQIHRH